MVEVRTRNEAICLVDQALHKWAVETIGLLAQAQATATAAANGAERVLRRCANEVRAIESLLAAAREGERPQLKARLARAEDAHEGAARASARLREVEAGIARLGRTVTRTATAEVPAARAQLTAMARALDGYRAGGMSFGNGALPRSNAAPRGGGPLIATGLADLDVASADLDDNPILDDAKAHGTFGKDGLSRADYRWAVQAWNDVVGPGVAQGKTREDFVERDAQSNAMPLRRTADVYDLFLGSDRIRVDRQANGSLNIINGRHRFLIARELGIRTLPGQVAD